MERGRDREGSLYTFPSLYIEEDYLEPQCLYSQEHAKPGVQTACSMGKAVEKHPFSYAADETLRP